MVKPPKEKGRGKGGASRSLGSPSPKKTGAGHGQSLPHIGGRPGAGTLEGGDSSAHLGSPIVSPLGSPIVGRGHRRGAAPAGPKQMEVALHTSAIRDWFSESGHNRSGNIYDDDDDSIHTTDFY